MKFLVADHSATMWRIVINSLQRTGFTSVVDSGDGEEALEPSTGWSISSSRISMANMSGIDFARALRARPEGQNLPILMVTTRNVREDILAAVQTGVNNYVVMPFTPQMKEKIDQVVATVATGS